MDRQRRPPAREGATGTLEERRERALAAAFRYLGRRDRTVAQVRAHLAARGMGDELGESVIAELAEQGYLDDAGYAHRCVEDRRALDGWGSERIARLLTSDGVPPELIEPALGGRGRDEELEAAVRLLRERLGAPPADDRARNRALGLLVRRGYEPALAYEAVHRAEGELSRR